MKTNMSDGIRTAVYALQGIASARSSVIVWPHGGTELVQAFCD